MVRKKAATPVEALIVADAQKLIREAECSAARAIMDVAGQLRAEHDRCAVLAFETCAAVLRSGKVRSSAQALAAIRVALEERFRVRFGTEAVESRDHAGVEGQALGR